MQFVHRLEIDTGLATRVGDALGEVPVRKKLWVPMQSCPAILYYLDRMPLPILAIILYSHQKNFSFVIISVSAV